MARDWRTSGYVEDKGVGLNESIQCSGSDQWPYIVFRHTKSLKGKRLCQGVKLEDKGTVHRGQTTDSGYSGQPPGGRTVYDGIGGLRTLFIQWKGMDRSGMARIILPISLFHGLLYRGDICHRGTSQGTMWVIEWWWRKFGFWNEMHKRPTGKMVQGNGTSDQFGKGTPLEC